MQINILEGSWLCRLVLMGCVSVTLSYSFHCLTTETVKYINENSFIENLAASKYSMGHREANKCRIIINNKCRFCMFRRRADYGICNMSSLHALLTIGFPNNKHILHKASIFVHAHVD